MLHAIAALALFSLLFDYLRAVPHGWFHVATAIAAACVVTAFALRPRETTDPPLDAMDVGLRFGCGTVFGAVTIPGVAWARGWTDTPLGLALVALVGGAVCGALAVRFGEAFWRWVRGPRSPF